MTKFLAVLVACLPALAQSTLPQNYVGIGAGYNGGTIPNANVTATYAALVIQSAKLYSFTSGDYYSARTKPYSVTSSLRTGAAIVIRSWGWFTLLETLNVGAAGMSTGGLTASVGTGAVGIARLPKGWALAVDVHEAKAISSGNWALQSVLQVGRVW